MGKSIAWIRTITANDARTFSIYCYHLERAEDTQQKTVVEEFFRGVIESSRNSGTPLFDYDELTEARRQALLQSGKTAKEFIDGLRVKVRDVASNRMLEVCVDPAECDADV